MTKDEAKALLKLKGLRITSPRLAVVLALANSTSPLSHKEMLEMLGETDWDPATIYRNLVKLTDMKVTSVVSRADGMSRYALVLDEQHDEHEHPHFLCKDCGKVLCLPLEVAALSDVDPRWRASVQSATIQLHGECPECIKSA